MDTARWNRIEALFEQLASLPPEDREAALLAEVPDDAALREEVSALLAADPLADPFLDRLEGHALSAAVYTALDIHDPLLGERLGPFRLEERIGRGGMGTVYRAERADGTFEQTVAVKVLRTDLGAGFGGDRLGAERFLAERRILARLEHPAIARLVDGGLSTDGAAKGQPWLAMEFVEGEPITAYADRRRLSINERLALFTEVCEAVTYAHGRLVVHRDLKPENILVITNGPTRGQVKLLDFGVAKLLDDDQATHAGLTRTGRAPMTPAYAAPEQVRGEAVSVATDVYALGVLLYELLTGRRPYRLPSRQRQAVERAILEAEPTRPSTAVSEPTADTRVLSAPRKASRGTPVGAALGTVPPLDLAEAHTRSLTLEEVSSARQVDVDGLRRRLAGDLDAIILTALRKEPERRYASAQAFCDDIGRHLDGQPVSARPDTVRYRAGKFVRRHRSSVLAAALVVLSLVGGLGAALAQADRAEREAERARTEAATAEAVTGFLVGLFQGFDPAATGGETVSAEALLERGSERLALDLGEQPELRARLLHTLGQVHLAMGRLDQADSLLHQAYETSTLIADDRARAPLEVLIITRLGLVHQGLGQGEQAASQLREAIARADALGLRELGIEPRILLSHMLSVEGAFDESRSLLLEARRLEAERSRGEPSQSLISISNNLGTLAYFEQDYERASDAFAETIDLFEAYYGERPHPDYARTLDNLAAVLLQQERFEEAEPVARRALAMQRTLYRDEPAPATAISLNNLGVILLRMDRLDEAEAVQRESLEIKYALYGPDHPSTGITYSWLARIAAQEGDIETAERFFRNAIRIAEHARPPGHAEWGGPMREFANMLESEGRVEEAEAHYIEAYQRTREHFGDEHVFTVNALRPLPGFYAAHGQPEESARYAALLEAAEAEPPA